ELGDLISNIMIVPTKKHGDATAEDIKSGFLLLDHPEASLSKTGFPAVSDAEDITVETGGRENLRRREEMGKGFVERSLRKWRMKKWCIYREGIWT
ncbi:hypothetical protein Csa_023920, partial [Cucumis sativus]